jgi:hypothetical protein
MKKPVSARDREAVRFLGEAFFLDVADFFLMVLFRAGYF